METSWILPDVEDEDAKPFWAGTARGELLVQKCSDCGRMRIPPRPMCPQCRSLANEWVPLSGKGRVWSFVVPHPPLLPAFTAAFPDVGIDLLLSDAVIDIVAERIDVAIRLGRRSDSTLISSSTLVSSQLLPVAYHVCASPHYLSRHGPLQRPDDLTQRECLLLPYAGFRSRWIFRNKQGELTEIPVKGRVVISTAAAVLQCAVAGMGPTLLPRWLIEGELRSSALVDVFPDYDVTATDFDTAIWLLYPSRTYVPRKVRAFADFVKQEIRERPPW